MEDTGDTAISPDVAQRVLAVRDQLLSLITRECDDPTVTSCDERVQFSSRNKSYPVRIRNAKLVSVRALYKVLEALPEHNDLYLPITYAIAHLRLPVQQALPTASRISWQFLFQVLVVLLALGMFLYLNPGFLQSVLETLPRISGATTADQTPLAKITSTQHGFKRS